MLWMGGMESVHSNQRATLSMQFTSYQENLLSGRFQHRSFRYVYAGVRRCANFVVFADTTVMSFV